MEKKTEVHGIYKVTEGILINKDNDALKIYKSKKAREKRIDIIQQDVNILKDDIKEIKDLLRSLVK